ncbi:T9SS type A sorting domain-containing protein [Hymenobacter terricola]|uniref:T9SS type A sorting domain-containing protein n=1 Tax=Hymenobacter terricola TaxID=2819236 RepID=UPI001B305ED3|nr:T9SS type A sorting domain-containing protein [Hymenobacter terricola]
MDNVTISSGSPLPVELTRFDAAAKGAGVNLTWATATEKSNDHFDVQRSATGGVFQTIGSVQGQGNTTNAHEYAFVDSRPLAGLSYYRLRQVDTDGTSAYSPVATVQTKLGGEVAAYPNPSAGTVTLPASTGPVRYRVFNALGQTLLSGQAAGEAQLDVSKLTKGTFYLELTTEAGHTTQRLMRE